MILFGFNSGTAAGWRGLTRQMREAGHGRALVMVDQEGGDIRTVQHVGPAAGQPLQGGPAEVRRAARSAGRGLRAAGINVNLAPVADLPRAGSVMAGRAFAGDERGIAARTRASIRGLRDARVAATAKHFPGLGAATVNTDDGPATVRSPIGRDLVPFRAAIDEGVPLVMLSHASYPALDSRRIASQSRAVVTGLLRKRLGFEGVIVTDSMEAQAVMCALRRRRGGGTVDTRRRGPRPHDGLRELERRLPASARRGAQRPGVPQAHPGGRGARPGA